MSSNEAVSEKAALRLLRILGNGQGRCRPAARAGRVLVEVESSTIGTDITALEDLARRGLIGRTGDKIALTMAGRAMLKRGLACGDGFREQHGEFDTTVIETAVGRQQVTINHGESPLALLFRRRTKTGANFLSEREFRAGERLRADYARGRIMARIGVNWQAAGAAGSQGGDRNGIADLTDAALAARQKFERAIAAVGPELSGVLIDVCCFLKGLEMVEAERSWPSRSAKVMLKSALGMLARHYDPPRPERSGGRKPILHWGTTDYRPSLG